MAKFYITTAIDYVNGPPHIGHAAQKIWADIIARWHRLDGEGVWFLTGTDEHGVNIVRTAEERGISPRELADENSQKFRSFKERLNLSWDDFIRTTDEERHWPGAVALWKKLQEAGDIYKGEYRGLYCAGHEAFITQKDLVDGKCELHGKEPEVIDEENYFFRLSRYTKPIREAIESDLMRVIPEARKNEILALLEEGLEDISFSRPSKDISWGIPVPQDRTQTQYVWFEALTNYLSAIGYGRGEEWQKWWPADVHVLGVDNLRFHAAIWPGILLSAKLPLPKTILVNGFVQVGGRKMSKTLGNIVDPFRLAQHYGTDAVRYYISREISIFNGGDFTDEKFHEAYEANLVNGVGNYVRRVSTMIRTYFSSRISRPSEASIAKVPLLKSLNALSPGRKDFGKAEYFSVPYVIEQITEPKWREALESYELNRAADIAFGLLSELDRYVQDYEPFKLVKTDPEKTQAVLWNLAYGAVRVARLLSPFLPETSEKIFGIFGVTGKEGEFPEFVVSDHEPLFPRISP